MKWGWEMKKVLLIALFLVLGMSLVLAAQYGSAGNANKSSESNRTIAETNKTNQGIGQNLSGQVRARIGELKAGEYNGSLGQLLRVRELAQNLRELRVNNVSAITDLNITAETDADGKTRFRTRLRNNTEMEIKIMPDSAAERALERLRLKVCSEENNCTIQLKDVGNGEERIRYEVQIERHSRILGIFQKKMQVQAQVNAENGEVINVGKPWWAFIASEPEE